MDWLSQYPLLLPLPDGTAYMSHAGISPQWSLEEAVDHAEFAHEKYQGLNVATGSTSCMARSPTIGLMSTLTKINSDLPSTVSLVCVIVTQTVRLNLIVKKRRNLSLKISLLGINYQP